MKNEEIAATGHAFEVIFQFQKRGGYRLDIFDS